MDGGKKRREKAEKAKKHTEYLREKEESSFKACQKKEEVGVV